MTLIEAAEDSFSRANTYFVLTWIITALVIATAFVDFRTYRGEVAVNDRLIERYASLEQLASDVARDIRTAVYLSPGYKSERAGIDTLRRLRSAVLNHVLWFETDTLQKTPDMELEDRVEFQSALRDIKAFLLLNDATPDQGVHLTEEASLLLAEHEAGTYLVTDRINELRIEDAARYLWLTTLNLDVWNEVLSRHRAAIEGGQTLETLASDFAKAVEPILNAQNRKRRETAKEVWVEWLRSTSDPQTTDTQESRRRASLTLAQTSEFLEQAYRSRAELELRAGGEASVIELPFISLPLQLRDAILVAPWVLAACFLAIVIYMKRAVRYARTANLSNEIVVGKAPVFLAYYGLSDRIGMGIAALLLVLPVILVATVLPFLLPAAVTSDLVESILYFGGTFLALVFGIWTILQLPHVFALIDKGIAIRE